MTAPTPTTLDALKRLYIERRAMGLDRNPLDIETLLATLAEATDDYPPELLAKRRAEFVEAIHADPRSESERAQDADYADWQATNESNRP